MYLADLAWPELDDVPREAVVLLPLAGFEQHSRHLPFGTDAFLLEALLRRVEGALGDRLLILPILPIGYATRHLPFRGSLSIPATAYVDGIVEIGLAVAAAGFGRFLLLNGQYDNAPQLELALRALRERRSGFDAIAVSYWDLVGERPTHAGELETSLMLHLHPKRVRRDRVARDGIRSASQFAEKVLQYARMDQRTHHGGVGDPENASPERGKAHFDAITTALTRLIREFHDGLLTG